MILVRVEFQTKWGQAQEAVERFKAGAEMMRGQTEVVKRSRILTDLSGSFDTVVVETEVESIDAYFAWRDALFASPEFQEAQAAQAATPYESGSLTFYTIEATLE